MSEDLIRRGQVLPDSDVIAFAKEAVAASREDTRRSVNDEGATRELQQPGVTIDLGHKNVQNLPEEVIDIIKDDIERLAISHNLLSTLPHRLFECRRLRYLNVRYNAIKDFPEAILQLSSLEILDVSKNRIKVLPDDIANLTSLKVLAIQKNKIERLPYCLGDISSLHVLKLDGNPIDFPPREICTLRKDTPIPANENERDAVITTQVKRYLRQIATRERLRVESEGDSSESNLETPRPLKGVTSGRFPVKPSISGIDSFDNGRPESPGLAPPIPNRSHFRVQSQQNNGPKKTNIGSSVINSNERNRSQSEGASSATIRQKRGGLVISNVPDLGAVEEVKSRPLNHLRGWSQGSGLSGSTFANGSAPSTSFSSGSIESQGQRLAAPLNRPLSDLLEHKRRSRAPDVAVEASKNVLFAMSQLRDPIINLIQALGPDIAKSQNQGREELFKKLNAAFSDLRDLGQHLRKFDTLAEEDEEDALRLSLSVRQIASHSLLGFISLMTLIMENANEIVRDGDVRFVRTFLLLLQGSIIEVRSACAVMGLDFKKNLRLLKQAEKSSVDGVKSHPNINNRQRKQNWSAQAHQNSRQPPLFSSQEFASNNGNEAGNNVRIPTPTPRSGESFGAIGSINISQSSSEYDEEESKFEKVYLKLRAACASVENMSFIRDNFVQAKSITQREYNNAHTKIKILNALVLKSEEFLSCTQALSESLQQIKLRDPGARNNVAFWQQCYIQSKVWSEFVALISGEASKARLVQEDVRQAMRPIHRAVKDAINLIHASPWSHLTRESLIAVDALSLRTTHMKVNEVGNAVYHAPNPINTSLASPTFPTSASQGYVTPVPATPLSAALGAAAQATVPSTPGNGSSQPTFSAFNHVPMHPYASALSGIVFERGDRLPQTNQRRT